MKTEPVTTTIIRPRIIRNLAEAIAELRLIGVDDQALNLMAGKTLHLNLKLENVDPRAANILKQEMLSLGGADAAVARTVSEFSLQPTDVLLTGSYKQYQKLIAKLKHQNCFGLLELGSKLAESINNLNLGKQYNSSKERVLDCGKHKLKLGTKTFIMGVLNVTPDSFSDGGKYIDPQVAVEHAFKLETAGADIIDIGGESTRPGAEPVDAETELARVLPVIETLIETGLKVPISIDTMKATVANKALDAGASIINDVSGLRHDSLMMVKVATDYDVPVVIMHMLGDPRTMQLNPTYKDVIGDIYKFFETQTKYAIANGIKAEKIIIDPGIGFGKNLNHNIEIIRRLSEFQALGYPILIGPSRKRFMGEILNLSTEQWLASTNESIRLWATLGAVVVCVVNGADIIRVHDVHETIYTVKIADAILRQDSE